MCLTSCITDKNDHLLDILYGTSIYNYMNNICFVLQIMFVCFGINEATVGSDCTNEDTANCTVTTEKCDANECVCNDGYYLNGSSICQLSEF